MGAVKNAIMEAMEKSETLQAACDLLAGRGMHGCEPEDSMMQEMWAAMQDDEPQREETPMKITTTTSTETTIKVSGVQTCWDSLEAIKREVRKICEAATVCYLAGAPADGFQIMSPGNAHLLHDESFVKDIVENAVAEANTTEAKRVARQAEFVTSFKFRNVGKLKARGKYQKAIQEVVADEEDCARRAQRTIFPPEKAYFAMFDMPAYYSVWDAVRKHGWKKAAETAQHQDTAVREVFCEFFDMLEDEGKTW